MPSFDIESKINQVELHNAVDQANKELSTRFDFKGQNARVEFTAAGDLETYADDDFKLEQLFEVLAAKLAKRGVDIRAVDRQPPVKISGDKLKQLLKVRQGLDSDHAKSIVKLLKESKLKVTAAIQGEMVRVSGAKRDVLQDAISLVREKITTVPLQFGNFRE